MKEYKHNDYVKMYGLYYVYIHVYKGRILYVGKGTRCRCGKLTDSRSDEYVEFLNSINKKEVEKYILCESFDEELILACERLVHEYLHSIGYKVYSKANGERIRGNKLTKTQKENIRKSMIGKNSVPIIQLSLDNKFIKEHSSLANASRELNVNKGNLCKCLKGERNHCGGFKWFYKTRYEELIRTGQMPSFLLFKLRISSTQTTNNML